MISEDPHQTGPSQNARDKRVDDTAQALLNLLAKRPLPHDLAVAADALHAALMAR